MEKPLISIICTVYNQAAFIEDCLDSVFSQDYPNFELIIHDNGSTDGSAQKIRSKIEGGSGVVFKALEKNIGLPKAFNLGYALSNGEFIMDLSGDDMLAKGALENFIDHFSNLGTDYGVVYSNAVKIDRSGKELGSHFRPGANPPQGEVFSNLLEKYIISAPTMMFRKSVIEALKGYDENLIYEDFDFWIRSSRRFKYSYVDYKTIYERQHKASFSNSTTDPEFEHSTYLVCEKALDLVMNKREHAALQKRIIYHLKQCIINKDDENLQKYIELLNRCKPSYLTRTWINFLRSFPSLIRSSYFLLKSPFSTRPT